MLAPLAPSMRSRQYHGNVAKLAMLCRLRSVVFAGRAAIGPRADPRRFPSADLIACVEPCINAEHDAVSITENCGIFAETRTDAGRANVLANADREHEHHASRPKRRRVGGGATCGSPLPDGPPGIF